MQLVTKIIKTFAISSEHRVKMTNLVLEWFRTFGVRGGRLTRSCCGGFSRAPVCRNMSKGHFLQRFVGASAADAAQPGEVRAVVERRVFVGHERGRLGDVHLHCCVVACV